MIRFKAIPLFVMLGLGVSLPALASNYCIAVNKGFGHGGTSYIGPSFALPASGGCKPWAGFTRTASTVIAIANGTGCLSSDGAVFTLSVSNADPEFFGAGMTASDYVQICPKGVANCPISGSDQGNFNGSAKEETCTNALLKLPDTHD